MFTPRDAEQLLLAQYHLKAIATPLPGESDCNFHIKTDTGDEYLLKLSRAHGQDALIPLQNSALAWLQRSQRPFDFPQLLPLAAGGETGHAVSAQGEPCHVRLLTFIQGQLLAKMPCSTALLHQLGRQAGYLTQALVQFRHPAANRRLKWDLRQADWIETELQAIDDPEDRRLVSDFLAEFKGHTAPLLPDLRQSIIHGDLNDYNIVVRPNQIGFIDFGDLVQTATICELAIALAYTLMHRDDPLAAAMEMIRAYHRVFPLEEREVDVLYHLVAMRLCVSVVNSALRKKENPDNAYLTISEQPAWTLLKQWQSIDPSWALLCFRQACGFPDQLLSKQDALLFIRKKVIADNVGLSYHQPLTIVRGEGAYLYDETGRAYLDCVNNVCHVGHCHPKVVAAGQRQMALLNTNTRYLHPNLMDYAKRLLATLPLPLEVCFFVSSGSEANELALRLAYTHTRRRQTWVIDQAYHGNTSTLINISPYKFKQRGGSGQPDWVDVFAMPDPLRGNLTPLLPHGSKPGVFIAESLLSCGGQIELPPGYLQSIYTAVRAAGGVCIADEIQVGLGRVGSHTWGFETQGVVPDIVTMGKPLGNGHPIGAVVTTRAIAASFNNGLEYFSTFGGNPVSCAIGLSVLDVIHEEDLQAKAWSTGHYLKQRLLALNDHYECIGDVRGLGLFLGVELVKQGGSVEPDRELTGKVVNRMKEQGVLLSSDGPYHNVLKIKPPLVFGCEEADILVDNLDKVLASLL
ncbi:aminotransferase class III-fold pyridoxal phosphate-dependent enzyme [Legionella erythra]|uniref:Aminotransferase class-III n=1 Tax=Legionella erythra TaxID=448 RepID=A0A0W0TX73_LEGER|nr:aminotransferase class III-fold pyridoxal phosphate-dependent enzyme [Legionella erythra]KTC99979.1 aminotransferase class-III [Legionella erythra]